MQLEHIAVDMIEASPDQNRQHFDQSELRELAKSIEELGVLQPVKVRARGDGFVLVAGERRLRAVRDVLELETIPAVLEDGDDADAALGTLAENLMRVDPAPLEEATGYDAVATRYGMTSATIARRVGVPESRVRRRLGLLTLGDEVRHYLASNQLPVGRAELMAGLDVNRQHLALAAHHEGIGTDAYRKLIAKLQDDQSAESMFDADSFMVAEVVAEAEAEVRADNEALIVREAPLGMAEIAQLLEVKRSTVHMWSHRGRLPAPDLEVSGVSLWWRASIERWARETGRMTS